MIKQQSPKFSVLLQSLGMKVGLVENAVNGVFRLLKIPLSWVGYPLSFP
jgi:hypothetical protein